MSTDAETAPQGPEMIACDNCGNMVPEANMSIHRAHACRGVARSSTREDEAREDEKKDEDVIDLSADDSPNRRKRQDEAPPSSPPPRRRQRRGRPKRDDEDAMEIDDDDDDDDDEVEIVNNPEVVDLLDDDDEWQCQRCTLLNDKNKSVCVACHAPNPSMAAASASSDGVRAADPVRRERLIDDSYDPYYFAMSPPRRSGGSSSHSPLSVVAGGSILGGILGAAGAYANGRSVTSGALRGSVAGAMGGVLINELSPPPQRRSSSRRSQYDNSFSDLSEARSAGANGQPAYPSTAAVGSRPSRRPRSSVRVVSTPNQDGTTTTIVSSSGRDGSTRIVRRSQNTHSGLDPIMSLILHSSLQGRAGAPGRMTRFGGAGDVDRMSYEQLLAAYGDGSENMGASGGAIASLPTSKVKTKADGTIDLPSDACECSICLEEFEKGQTRKTLPCLHGFHSTCVDKWLRTNGACPVCKFRVDERGSS